MYEIIHDQVNIIMKPTNSPTQGQKRKKEIRSKVASGPFFFPQQILFRGMGLILNRKQTTTNLTQTTSPQTPYLERYVGIEYLPDVSTCWLVVMCQHVGWC